MQVNPGTDSQVNRKVDGLIPDPPSLDAGSSSISRVRAHEHTHDIRQWEGLEREMERDRDYTREWHYIVGLASAGKLGGQSFDRLFGK